MQRSDRDAVDELHGNHAGSSSRRDKVSTTDTSAPTTIRPKNYSLGGNWSTAVKGDDLHAPRGGRSSLSSSQGTSGGFVGNPSYPRAPPRRSMPGSSPNDNKATANGFSAKRRSDKTAGASPWVRKPRETASDSGLPPGRQSPVPIEVSDDEDLPAPQPSDSAPRTSHPESSKPAASTSFAPRPAPLRQPPTLEDKSDLIQSPDEWNRVPAVDLTALRPPKLRDKMKGKGPATSQTASSSTADPGPPVPLPLPMPRNPRDKGPHIPYKRIWWGARCYQAAENGEPEIVCLRNKTPALLFFQFENWNKLEGMGSGPSYIIPFQSLHRVEYSDPKAPSLWILLRLSGIVNKGRDAPERLGPFFQPAGDQMAFASVVIEVDTNNARWRNKDEDHMLASRTLYRNMIERISNDPTKVECRPLNETSIKSLVEQHVLEVEQYGVQLPSTKRTIASSSSKHTATRLYQPMSEQKPKRQRSPSPNDSSKRRALPKSAPEQDSEWAVREAGSSKPAPPKKVKSSELPPRRSGRRLNPRKILDDTDESDAELIPARPPISNPHELVVVYPPTGVGAVNVTRGDYKRLDPGEFFNDTLIEFGLKHSFNRIKELQPDYADQIHIFNSFFYKKLSSKAPSDGYQSVRKWTAKINFFEKRYIIIPINENFHWYLAIIYEPGNVLPPNGVVPPAAPVDTRTSARLAPRLSSPKTSAAVKQTAPPALPKSNSTETVSLSDSDVSPDQNTKVASPPSDSSSMKEVVMSASQVSLGDEEKAKDEDAHILVPDSDDDAEAMPDTSLLERPQTPPNKGQDAPTVGSPMDVDVRPRNASASPKLATTAPRDVVDLDPNEPDELDSQPTSSSLAAPPVTPKTYAKGKGKATTTKADVPQTKIFLLDSLGAQHGGARGVLAEYLLQEAHDKKKVPEDAMTNPAVREWFRARTGGVNVKVPVQPNHCDCGPYLLHFADTFLEDPINMIPNMISRPSSTQDKNAIWKKHDVEERREQMRRRIDALAAEWRALKTGSSSEKREESAVSPDPEPIPASISMMNPSTAVAPSPEPITNASSPVVEGSVGLQREPSSDTGEVEDLLGRDRSSVSTPNNSLLQHQLQPSGMDLDLEESSVIPYEPDSIANSIMNPPSPPPLFGATVFSDSVDATLTKHVTTVPDGPGHSSTPHASTSERSPSPAIPIPLPILSHPQSSKFFSGASASTSGSGKPGTSRRVIEQDEETMTASGSSSDGEPPERWSMNSKLAQRREAGREAERGTSKSAAATSATGPKASPELRSQYSLPRTEAAQNRAPVPKQPLPTPVVVSDDGDSDFEIIEAPSKPTTPKTLTEYFSPKSSKSSPIVEVVIPVINRTKPTARLPPQPSSPSKRKNATGPRHHADQFSELMPGQPTNPSTSASAGPSSSRNSALVPFDGVSQVSGRVIRASDAFGSGSNSTHDAAGTSEGRANRLR